jgi:ribosomal protein S18 acetylase RimI-like enzyme
MTQTIIQRIEQLSFDEISSLIQESLQEEYNFIQRLKDEYLNGVNCFDKFGESLFVARADYIIVGICGLNIDPYLHNLDIGRVRHLYVSKNYRKQGIGHLIMEHVINDAIKSFKTLILRTNNPLADKLYRDLGFSNEPFFENASHYLHLSR